MSPQVGRLQAESPSGTQPLRQLQHSEKLTWGPRTLDYAEICGAITLEDPRHFQTSSRAVAKCEHRFQYMGAGAKQMLEQAWGVANAIAKQTGAQTLRYGIRVRV